MSNFASHPCFPLLYLPLPEICSTGWSDSPADRPLFVSRVVCVCAETGGNKGTDSSKINIDRRRNWWSGELWRHGSLVPAHTTDLLTLSCPCFSSLFVLVVTPLHGNAWELMSTYSLPSLSLSQTLWHSIHNKAVKIFCFAGQFWVKTACTIVGNKIKFPLSASVVSLAFHLCDFAHFHLWPAHPVRRFRPSLLGLPTHPSLFTLEWECADVCLSFPYTWYNNISRVMPNQFVQFYSPQAVLDLKYYHRSAGFCEVICI